MFDLLYGNLDSTREVRLNLNDHRHEQFEGQKNYFFNGYKSVRLTDLNDFTG